MPVLQRVTGALNRVSGDAAIASHGAGGYTQSFWTGTGTNYWAATLTMGLTTGDPWIAAFWIIFDSSGPSNSAGISIGDGTASANAGMRTSWSPPTEEFQPRLYDSGGTSRVITNGAGGVSPTGGDLLLCLASADNGTNYRMSVSQAGVAVDTGSRGITGGTRWTGIYDDAQTIGADHDGSGFLLQLDDQLADVFFDSGTYYDVHDAAVIGNFWNGTSPKDPGTDGSGYLGSQPLIFCGGTGYDWSGATCANLGSLGGVFTYT